METVVKFVLANSAFPLANTTAAIAPVYCVTNVQSKKLRLKNLISRSLNASAKTVLTYYPAFLFVKNTLLKGSGLEFVGLQGS